MLCKLFLIYFAIGPPTIINLVNHTVDTQQNLTISITIRGYPLPDVTLYHMIDGTPVEVSTESNPRLTIFYENMDYIISFRNIYRVDGGTYMISASNNLGDAADNFIVTTMGECLVSRSVGQSVSE